MTARGDHFYRRDPAAALAGMASLTPEERGIYNTVLDLLYLTWRPLEDDRRYIASHCNCAIQKLNPILRRLIEMGKLMTFEEDGQTYISNRKFEEERNSVRREKTRSGRGEVREKSASVEEKSASVGKKHQISEEISYENQNVVALDKIREDKNISIDFELGNFPPPDKPKRPSDQDFETWYRAYPRKGDRIKARKAFDQAWKFVVGEDRLAVLVSAAEAYGRRCTDPKFTKLPATWLNAGAWMDEEPALPLGPAPSPPPDQQARIHRLWLKGWVNDRDWQERKGPKPNEPGCVISDEILAEFGLERAKPTAVA